MPINSVKAYKKRQAEVKQRNLDQWYENNEWARHDRGDDDRDYADVDYPGRGLEFDYWDIPN